MAINKYNITADKTSLDTYEDVDISLNYQIDDILDIAKRNTSYSKTISLPGTPVNNKFFKQMFDVNIDNISFNPNKRIPSVIRIGDNEVFNGFLRLVNVYNKNKEITYDVSFIGSLKDIMSTIEDYTLRDLDLSKYNHTRNRLTQINSWDYIVKKFGQDSSVGTEGEGYVYPYIINGNSSNVYDTAYVFDLFPAPYVKTVIDALFDFAGFTYTSDFFNSDYFKKLIIPCTIDKLQLSSEEYNERKVVAGIPGNSDTYIQATPTQTRGSDWYYNDSINYKLAYPGPGLTRESGVVDDNGTELEFTDDLGQWNDDIFTCSKPGRYNIQMEGKCILKVTHDNNKPDIEFKEGSFEYRYQMFLVKAGGGSILISSSIDPNDPNDIYGVQLFQPGSGTHQSPWYDIDTPLVFAMSASDLFMEVGDKIHIRFGFRYPQAVKWYGSSDNKHRVALTFKQSLDGGFTKFIVEPSSNQSFGDEYVNLSQTLPDKFKQKDFLLDIIKMFNLIVMDNPNKDGDLIIEPRDAFFRSKQKVLDWEGEKKLDNDSTVKITPMSELDAKRYLYTYKLDDDLFNKEYENETDKVYGEYSVDVINDFSTNTNKTEISFASTPNSSQFINGRVAPFFAEKDDENLKPKKVKPRILFYGGRIGGSYLKLFDFPNGPYSGLYDYPYCGMWDNPSAPSYSLEFGSSMKHYWNTNLISLNTLFEKFHKSTLKTIIDVNSRMLEASFHLTPSDIAQFDFRDIIFLMGSYWRVNKIKDYNPAGADSLTKVELYKIIDLDIVEPFQVIVPISNQHCPDDMVSKSIITKKGTRYIYTSSSGLPVTEDCCTSFKGVLVNGVCQSPPLIPSLDWGDGIKVPFTNGIGTSEPVGPLVLHQDNNTKGRLGVKVSGIGNYVSSDSKMGLIVGDNNTINPNVTGAIIIGDGITANESGVIYYGDMKINQDGNIMANGIVVIDGGEDEVFDFDKTNLIDVVDGTVDSVRNPGGDSKARPIISNENPN
jgi:hypothetical protein